jgi:hypothetical protein
MDDSTQRPDTESSDWLLPGGPTTDDRGSTESAAAAVGARRAHVPARQLAVPALLVAGGVLAGGLGVWALQDRATTPIGFSARASADDAPFGGPRGQQDDDGQAFDGRGGGPGAGPGSGFGGGFGGGFAGEQHVSGTLTAVGASSITVRTASGTQAYTVTGTTDVQRNGSRVPLSALQVGDPVVVHAYPSGSTTVVERVLAGTMPAFGGPPPAQDGTRTG